MRKTISLVLAGVLALALLPGFGKAENTASVLTKEQEQLLQTAESRREDSVLLPELEVPDRFTGDWSGVEGARRVILRKVLAVTDGYEPVVGANFDVYMDPELRNHAKGIVKTESGETTVELKSLSSGASGILWIGELPYGTYYLKESNPSRVFILTVDKDGAGYKAADQTGPSAFSNQLTANG